MTITTGAALSDVERPLTRIATIEATKVGFAKRLISSDDLLQEMRLAAWQAELRAEGRGLTGIDKRRYMLGAARLECRRVFGRMRKDALWHSETVGLADDVHVAFYGDEGDE